MKYMVTKEIESEIKITKHIYFQDAAFLFIGVIMTLLVKEQVHDGLQTIFTIFSILVFIVLVLPSGINPKRRIWQSIALGWLRPKCVYQFGREEEDHGQKEKTNGRKRHRRATSR